MNHIFTDPYGEYLEHHGVKGQKWGVRRYQNEDGSRTLLGKRHRNGLSVSGLMKPKTKERRVLTAEEKKARKENRKEMYTRAVTPSMKQGKDKPQISPAENIAKQANKINDSIYSTTRNIRNRHVKTDPRATTMSDAELRQAINRMELEKRYTALSQSDVESGFDKVSDVLETVGALTFIAASAVSIASSVNEIRRGKIVPKIEG